MGRKKISDFAVGSKSRHHIRSVWTWCYGIFFRERSHNHHESSHFTANYHHRLLLLCCHSGVNWVDWFACYLFQAERFWHMKWNGMEWNVRISMFSISFVHRARRWGQELIYFHFHRIFRWTCWHALLRTRTRTATEQKKWKGISVDLGMCSCRASIMMEFCISEILWSIQKYLVTILMVSNNRKWDIFVYLNDVMEMERERERACSSMEQREIQRNVGHGNGIAEINGLFIWNAINWMRRVIAHQCSVRFVRIFR